MLEWISLLFDTSGFPQRWHCGQWSSLHGWVHIVSDLAIFGAYAAIPVLLLWVVRRRGDIPFRPLVFCFCGFILLCGLTHLIEASIFWTPWYRLSAVCKVTTAIASWGTVAAMIPALPQMFRLPSSAVLEAEVRRGVAELQETNEKLSSVRERLEQATSSGNIGIWDWSMITNSVVFSDIYHRQLEESPGTLGSFQDWKDRLHPDDRDRVMTQIDEYLRSSLEASFESEFRLKLADGTYRWFLSRGKAHSNSEGVPERMLGALIDITDRKREEERFFLAVEAAPIAMVMIDEGGQIELTNRYTENLFGYHREELIGEQVEKLLPESQRESHVGQRTEYLTNPETRRMGTGRAIRGRRRDGSDVPLEIGLSPVTVGSRTLAMAVIADITELESVHRAREQLLSDYQAMVELLKATDGVWEWRADNDEAAFAPGFRKLIGFDGDDFDQIPDSRDVWDTRLHPDDRADFWAAVTASVRERRPFVHECRLKHRSGSYIWVRSRANVAVHRDEPHRMVGSIYDVTLEKVAVEKMKQSNEDLERFANVASHDLQEPLRAVNGFCQLLEKRYDDKIDETGRRYIRNIVEGTTRMQALITDLLDFSRVSRVDIPMTSTDLNGCVQNALFGLSSVIEETGAQVECGHLPAVHGHAGLLTQLFQNLISNAIKFRRSGVTPVVRIAAAQTGSNWEIAVSDNGMGIPPEHQDQVFEMFKRLHRRDEIPGTGIGLAICKRIIDRHFGEISVRLADGPGAIFVVSLGSQLKTTAVP